MTTFRDQSGRVVDLLTDEIAKAVATTAVKIEREAVTLVNRPQPTRRTSSGVRYGTEPSRSGEPPKQVTGTLKREIASDTARDGDQAFGRVGFRRGTPASYAAFLDSGTSKMGARPFLRPALDKHLATFRAELADIRRRLG